MSDSSPPHRPKESGTRSRAPRFEARQQPLPAPPRPLYNLRDPFDEFPEVRPRAPHRSTIQGAGFPPPLPPPAPLFDDEPLRPTRRVPVTQADTRLRGVQIDAPSLPQFHSAAPFAEFQVHASDIPRVLPWRSIIVGLVCVGIILFFNTPSRTIISRYGFPGVSVNAVGHDVSSFPDAPPGEHSILGNPTITADQINAVLAQYGSPAADTGAIWIEMGQRYGIDPAYALAFFIHESTAGTNPGWAGHKPDGATTHNIGNIICAGYPTCFGRFRDYQSWAEGIEDWYHLISKEYVQERQVFTIEQIIPIYAPSFENNVPAYVQAVVGLVQSWQQGVQQ